MTARLLAFPFGISSDGSCRTVDQGTDEQYEQLLRVTIGTRQGEREMCPSFGLVDTVWRGLYSDDVQAAVDEFGPPIVIDEIAVTIVDGSEQLAGISWHRKDEPNLVVSA